MSAGGVNKTNYSTSDININDFYTESYEKNGKLQVLLSYEKDLGMYTKVKNKLSFHEFKYGEDAAKLWNEAQGNKMMQRYLQRGISDPKVAAFAHEHFHILPITTSTRKGDLSGYIGDDKL